MPTLRPFKDYGPDDIINLPSFRVYSDALPKGTLVKIMSQKQNILITGGTGFVGLSLVEQLLARDHSNIEKITLFDSFLFKENCVLPLLRHPKVNVVIGDVRDSETLIKLTKEHNVIYALAALVGAPICAKYPKEAWDINFGHVKTITENANSGTKLLYVCTNSVYGDTGGTVSEKSNIRCISVYAQSKYEAEKLVLAKGGTSLRFATLAGLGWRQRRDLLVNSTIWKALTDGYILLYQPNAMRCYLSVNDAARALIYALDNYNKFSGEAFNTGNTKLNSSKIQLANKIKEFVPNFVIRVDEYNEDVDKRDYWVSNEKIESLGYRALEDFDTIIPQVIKGYKVLLHTEDYMLT